MFSILRLLGIIINVCFRQTCLDAYFLHCCGYAIVVTRHFFQKKSLAPHYYVIICHQVGANYAKSTCSYFESIRVALLLTFYISCQTWECQISAAASAAAAPVQRGCLLTSKSPFFLLPSSPYFPSLLICGSIAAASSSHSTNQPPSNTLG